MANCICHCICRALDYTYSFLFSKYLRGFLFLSKSLPCWIFKNCAKTQPTYSKFMIILFLHFHEFLYRLFSHLHKGLISCHLKNTAKSYKCKLSHTFYLHFHQITCLQNEQKKMTAKNKTREKLFLFDWLFHFHIGSIFFISFFFFCFGGAYGPSTLFTRKAFSQATSSLKVLTHSGGYDSLNESDSHRFIYLNAWSVVCRTVWEGLEGMVLFQEVCHCGWL